MFLSLKDPCFEKYHCYHFFRKRISTFCFAGKLETQLFLILCLVGVFFAYVLCVWMSLWFHDSHSPKCFKNHTWINRMAMWDGLLQFHVNRWRVEAMHQWPCPTLQIHDWVEIDSSFPCWRSMFYTLIVLLYIALALIAFICVTGILVS